MNSPVGEKVHWEKHSQYLHPHWKSADGECSPERRKNKDKEKLRKLKYFNSKTHKDKTPQRAETVPVNDTEAWTGVYQHK